MHFHFDFTVVEILWTLTFAAQLVLLVVLMGRDRMSRFPWFTASIVLVGLRLLTQKMLYPRMATIPFNAILISLINLGVIIGILVLAELARPAFGSVKRRTWALATVAMVAVGAVVIWFWGTWPAWSALSADPNLTLLRVMQLTAQKGTLLLDVLTIEVGLVFVLFGRRQGAGWRSHAQQIVVGLSTASIGQLAVQGILQAIFSKAKPHTQGDVQHILDLRDKIYNANNVIYLVVIAWWVACLWIDEPGTAVALEAAGEPGELPEGESGEAPAETEAPADESRDGGE